MRGRSRLAVVGGLVLALAVGCAGVGGPRADEPSARRDYAAALRLAGEDAAAGRTALEGFLRTHSRSVLADDAGLQLATLQHESGAPVAAIRTLERLLQRTPTADRSDEARVYLARLLAERGDVERAYREASRVRFSRAAPELRREAHRLLAELSRQRGDSTARLRWLGLVWSDARDARGQASVEAEIRAVVGALDLPALDAAAEQLGRRPPAAWVGMRRAALLQASGNDVGARAELVAVGRLALSPAEAEALRVAKARLAGGDARRLLDLGAFDARAPSANLRAVGVLGVVLPLTGRYATLGEASLQGILLSTGHFDPSRASAPGGIRLIIRDTGGEPARAASAVAELAANPEVAAIVGPLLADESEAAAVAAEAARIPLLTLSRRESVASGRPHVVRLGETPRLDAELMATYAVDTLGLKRFAILYPDVPFGRAMRTAFWDALEARGGEVVGVARYAPDATDFAGPIRRLIGYELLSWGSIEAVRERDRMMKRAKRLPAERAAAMRQKARAVTGPGGRALPPFVDFDALFIPDTFETVGLVGPHLAFHEVRGVRLLGTSSWNDPELLRLAGRHLDGAVFAAGSFGDSVRPHLAEFHGRAVEAFGHEPDDLTAAAFDATNLATATLARKGNTRSRFLGALRAFGRWPGVSGTIGFEPDGSVWKRPHLLGIERGALVSVDERSEPPYLRMREPKLHCEEAENGTEVCSPPSEAAGARATGVQRAKTSR